MCLFEYFYMESSCFSTHQVIHTSRVFFFFSIYFAFRPSHFLHHHNLHASVPYICLPFLLSWPHLFLLLLSSLLPTFLLPNISSPFQPSSRWLPASFLSTTYIMFFAHPLAFLISHLIPLLPPSFAISLFYRFPRPRFHVISQVIINAVAEATAAAVVKQDNIKMYYKEMLTTPISIPYCS